MPLPQDTQRRLGLPETSFLESLTKPSITGLAQEVLKLQRRDEAAMDLLGQIIATLAMEQNQHCYQKMGEGPYKTFKEAVDRWEDQFKRLNNADKK